MGGGDDLRTSIVLDDELVNQAIKLSKLKTKREVVQEALKNYVAYMKKKELLNLKGHVADQVLLTPTILQEVLQGIREDSQYRRIKDIFSYFSVLQLPPVQAAIGVAELYRSKA